MFSKATILFAGFVFIVFSCAKKSPQSVDMGYDYYPTKQGKYVVYQIDSVVYNQIPADTVYYKYLIKEVVSDSYTDNIGNTQIRLMRYIKMYNPIKIYDSIPWSIKEVWRITPSAKSIVLLERDKLFMKLIFPVTQNATWNGNVLNTIGEWDYSYKYINQQEAINNVSLTNVLCVNQYNFRTAISYQNYFEKYARGVGLVYKTISNLQSNNVVAGVPVEQRIQSGITYTQQIIAYGYE
ncbi:MAG: hypothetical protein JSU07_05050 [Bacteroidetes bacterium]|nr:hypothetical protein [Bacteroidota bacterium]